MQQDMFTAIEDDAFALKPKRRKWNVLTEHHFNQYMIASLASWVMTAPLTLTPRLFESFNEYADDTLSLMAIHDNHGIVKEVFRRSEKLVELGYWNRYVTRFKIRYQNPRSFAGNMKLGTIPVITYGDSTKTLDPDKYQIALFLLCGLELDDRHSYRQKTWQEYPEEVTDIFQFLTRTIKHISPNILRGRSKLSL